MVRRARARRSLATVDTAEHQVPRVHGALTILGLTMTQTTARDGFVYIMMPVPAAQAFVTAVQRLEANADFHDPEKIGNFIMRVLRLRAGLTVDDDNEDAIRTAICRAFDSEISSEESEG